jgi:hypothetical protein
MLPKSVVVGLTAVAIAVGTALLSSAPAFARGAATGGAAGNWPQPGTWNWPEYAGRDCDWTYVKAFNHGRPVWHRAQVCR